MRECVVSWHISLERIYCYILSCNKFIKCHHNLVLQLNILVSVYFSIKIFQSFSCNTKHFSENFMGRPVVTCCHKYGWMHFLHLVKVCCICFHISILFVVYNFIWHMVVYSYIFHIGAKVVFSKWLNMVVNIYNLFKLIPIWRWKDGKFT